MVKANLLLRMYITHTYVINPAGQSATSQISYSYTCINACLCVYVYKETCERV